jgi:chemotaxis protein histidine kinase CheA
MMALQIEAEAVELAPGVEQFFVAVVLGELADVAADRGDFAGEMTLRPGFSTASEVSNISGRGVGMDIVRRNVESMRGTLTIDSQPGSGTTIDIRLPLTVAVIDGFAVGVCDETYVIPIDTIVECTEMTAEGDREVGVINLRGEPLPFVRLRSIFGFVAANGALKTSSSSSTSTAAPASSSIASSAAVRWS